MGIVLSSIFALALYGFFFTGARPRAQPADAVAARSPTGRTAIDRLSSELRQSVSPDDGLTPPLIALSPTEHRDVRRPLARRPRPRRPSPEKVRYAHRLQPAHPRARRADRLDARRSRYGAYAGREVLIDRLQNGAVPAFAAPITEDGRALPATPDASTQLRDVAQVSVRLLISQKTGANATTLELNTDVALRNAIRL